MTKKNYIQFKVNDQEKKQIKKDATPVFGGNISAYMRYLWRKYRKSEKAK